MVKTVVVYHSSTGNTRHCVEVVQAELHRAGHECDIVKCHEAAGDVCEGYDLVGVASAVYGFRPADTMLKFLRRMSRAEGKPAFALCCCSLVEANSLHIMARLLDRKGYRVTGGLSVRGEESWPAVRFRWLTIGKGRPNTDDDERIRVFTRETLKKVEALRAGREIPPPRFKRFSPWHLLGMITARPVMRWAMLGKFLDEEKCTKCGLCADVCPTRSITLDPFPRFGKGCMGCFACVNLCPEEAISTPLTWGRVRYKGFGAPPEKDPSR